MTLIVMAGLPGTGKSTLANALAQAIELEGAVSAQDSQQSAPIILNKDAIRAALFPPELIEYSVGQDDFCLDILLLVAKYLLAKSPNRIIILDGRTFSKRYQVEAVENAAAEMGIKVYWIECVCAPATAKQRLMHDKRLGQHPAVNRDPNLYNEVRVTAEPLLVPRVTVETTRPLHECVREIMAYLSSIF